MVNLTIIVFPYGQEDSSDASKSSFCGFPTILGSLTEGAIYTTYAFGFIGTFFGLPMSDLWLMMNGLQIAYLFPTIDSYMPSCMARYVWSLKLGKFLFSYLYSIS